jgi:hypothetical protein
MYLIISLSNYVNNRRHTDRHNPPQNPRPPSSHNNNIFDLTMTIASCEGNNDDGDGCGRGPNNNDARRIVDKFAFILLLSLAALLSSLGWNSTLSSSSSSSSAAAAIDVTRPPTAFIADGDHDVENSSSRDYDDDYEDYDWAKRRGTVPTGGGGASSISPPPADDDDDGVSSGGSDEGGRGGGEGGMEGENDDDDDDGGRKKHGRTEKTGSTTTSGGGGGSSPTSFLPIYLLEPSANRTAMIGWDVLANRWNRTTRYEDLLEMGISIPSLLPHPSSYSDDAPSSSSSSSGRIVVMIHCGPKTGSTTLRAACQSNLERTCGVRKRGRYPEGYMNESALYPLIRRCANTTHFCVKGVSMSPTEVPAYRDEDVSMFVHMFPFREYDAWAKSAMKQQYDRGGSRACDRTSRLLERCEHNNMEIDFRKYGKVRLSEFKDDVLRRMENMNESHALLLYHHLELTDVLGRLGVEYGLPLLPKSNETMKGKRPKGTCNAKLLEMFHDCFSKGLMELK